MKVQVKAGANSGVEVVRMWVEHLVRRGWRATIFLAVLAGVAGGEVEPIREAIRYEASGVMAFGAIAAIAGLVFAGQAVARQSRREWADLATLRALGMSDRDVRLAASGRGALTGAAAALVAAITAVALSPFGPIGVGRRAEVDPGFALDAPVLVAGTVGVLLVMTLASCLPLLHPARPSSGISSSSRRIGVLGPLPSAAIAGLGMTVGGRRDGRGLPLGTAVAGLAVAVASVVAATGLTTSLDRLTGTPERFGAPWDISVAANGLYTASGEQELTALLHDGPTVAAAGIVGTEIQIGGETLWVQTFRPIGDLPRIRPVITAGREPVAADEIALGSISMDELGVRIGDTVQASGTITGQAESTMTVVGRTVINDTYEDSPGRGGVVAPEWIMANSVESAPDPYVLRLEPEADVAAFAETLGGRAFVSRPLLQGAILNVERISLLPFLLAGTVGVLALASLAHALMLSIRRSRGQLAVWKAIGFTRGQVGAAVACHASALAVGAAIVGIPLGVVVGRLGWRVVADQIGVASGPVTPLLGVTATVLGAVVVANVIAAYPAWRAARLPTAEALRVE